MSHLVSGLMSIPAGPDVGRVAALRALILGRSLSVSCQLVLFEGAQASQLLPTVRTAVAVAAGVDLRKYYMMNDRRIDYGLMEDGLCTDGGRTMD